MAKKTYREVLQRASSFLESRQKEGYSIQFLFLARQGWSKTDWLLKMDQPILPAEEQQIAADMERLLADYPPQYLLGWGDFYGRQFKVNEATLIPRPETEELVALCLAENGPQLPLKVVDIGTGSGAIAVTLKAERPAWQVAASDISTGALQVAAENAAALQAVVDFREGSVLTAFPEEQFDVIIANPPYISGAEWDLMDKSVRTYEPKSALFAEADGLAVYQQIAAAAVHQLKPDGKIYLEIGFRQGPAVQALFQAAFPARQVMVKQDLAGHDRLIVIHNPCG